MSNCLFVCATTGDLKHSTWVSGLNFSWLTVEQFLFEYDYLQIRLILTVFLIKLNQFYSNSIKVKSIQSISEFSDRSFNKIYGFRTCTNTRVVQCHDLYETETEMCAITSWVNLVGGSLPLFGESRQESVHKMPVAVSDRNHNCDR